MSRAIAPLAAALAFLAVLLPAAPAAADTAGCFICQTGRHLAGDLTAGFYDAETRRWTWIGPAILGGTALGAGLGYRYLDDRWGSPTRRPHWPNASDDISQAGLIAGLALPPAFLATALFLPRGGAARARALDIAEQLGESLALTAATVEGLKYAVGRRRPNGGRRSFPSMHSAVDFSAAGVLLHEYPWYVGAPAMAFAAAVAASRVDLNAHYVSDVVAGAGIGFFFATAVHLYHRWDGAVRPKRLVLLPAVSRGGAGLLFSASY